MCKLSFKNWNNYRDTFQDKCRSSLSSIAHYITRKLQILKFELNLKYFVTYDYHIAFLFPQNINVAVAGFPRRLEYDFVHGKSHGNL